MEKGKKQKKVVAVLLLLAMIMAAAPVGVKADHEVPNKVGVMCNNTYRTYSHTGYQTSMYQGTHQMSDGSSCFINALVYKHSVTCTSCGAVVATPIYPCTTAHSRCGSRTVNHSGY